MFPIFYSPSVMEQGESMPVFLWTFWNMVTVETDQEINFLSRFLVWAVTSQSLRDGLACLDLLLPRSTSTQRTEMSPKVAGYVAKSGSRNGI